MPPAQLSGSALPELAMHTAGSGPVSIIFIHGNGNASSANWNGIVERLRREEVTTITYDRAGHGDSEFFTQPYSFDDEVRSLLAIVEDASDDGPVILVAHSFGGSIAATAAARNEDIDGVILVDAMTPGAFTTAMAQSELNRYRPQFDGLRAQAPKLAKAIIPRLEAFPLIAQEMDSLSYPEELPTVVIRAATSTYEDPHSVAQERAGLENFVAQSPWRHMMVAEGSSHQVMRDRPDVVIAAVEYMLDIVDAAPTE